MTSQISLQQLLTVCVTWIAMLSIASSQETREELKSRPGPRVNAQPDRVIEIKSSGKLDPTAVGGRLVITASNITIDGGGLTLVGGTGNPKSFTGTAISASGVSHVTLKNINAVGWETGLKIVDGGGWTIENCDFSGNFHDPDFGWGENGRRGGIVLERVRKSTLRKNRANNVWDACVLVDSDENTVEENDFSHTSNTCLKLWHASGNMIRKNVLSHGIRISPGEVHARDSTSVLIESGSNDNQFLENDCTHGGDGIFVRVLNGWCSTGNLFEKNDCSYANNNGFECWARDNLFRGNKANHCSYGFWLGGSDHTRLENNEASFNGLKSGHHNSPHLPGAGHAGIVFMFGPSSHSVARGNTCIGNNGAGIAVIGDLESKGEKWKAFHWIIDGNTLAKNRWGIYMQFADWIEIANNHFHDQIADANNNSVAAIQVEPGVTRLSVDRTQQAKGYPGTLPKVALDGPSSALIGEEVTFQAQIRSILKEPPTVAWDLGDGTLTTSSQVRHAFQKPGFYRVGVNVSNSAGTELAWRDFYVIKPVTELGTEGAAADWSIADFHDRQRSREQTSRAEFVDDASDHLAGKSALRVIIRPYAGFRAALTYPKQRNAEWSLAGKSKLVFWMKVINEDVTGWQGGPFFVLHGTDEQVCYIEPKPGRDLMRQLDYNEGRDGWRRMEIPLAGDTQWQTEGAVPDKLNAITMAFDSWGAPTLRIWIDGLALE
ncbi:MAG: right-handed parallel beta-helix repeat-containing protein [Planctomycetes bacterium]|nr:right-handed parallel beta-helix repeat-containing protein [Planctomycetota bacterium]